MLPYMVAFIAIDLILIFTTLEMRGNKLRLHRTIPDQRKAGVGKRPAAAKWHYNLPEYNKCPTARREISYAGKTLGYQPRVTSRWCGLTPTYCPYLLPVNGLIRSFPLSVVLQPCPHPTDTAYIPESFLHFYPLCYVVLHAPEFFLSSQWLRTTTKDKQQRSGEGETGASDVKVVSAPA